MANDLVVNVGADVSDLEDGMGQIKQNLAMVSDTLMEFGSQIADVFTGIMEGVFEAQESLTKFQNKTGATAESAKQLGKEMENAYKNGLGESLADVADQMAIVKQQSTLLGISSTSDITDITQRAMTLKDTFEFEVPESTRAAGAMIQNFGITAKEAFDYIAKGAQEGLNKSDDLIDTLNEYSPSFKMLGFNITDMFDILKKGSESGVFTVDKVADSIKEFGIRAKDSSSSTAEAFKALGLNADKMFKDFASGGDSSKTAFYKVIEALNNIKDPIKQNTVGVALFGTMFEDMGAKAILNLTSTKSAFTDLQKVSTQALSKLTDNITNNNTKSIDAFKTLGLNATELSKSFKKGGVDAQKSLGIVADALTKIKDPLKQNELGVALFGDMFKDVGAKAIINLGKASAAFKDVNSDINYALKLISVNAKINTKEITQAFKEIKLDPKTMISAFAKGGIDAQNAMFKIADALAKIKDPVEQNKIGIALFGSMFEDVGKKAILNLNQIESTFDSSSGTIDTINKNISKQWSTQWTKIKRAIEVDAIQPIGEALLPALEKIGKVAQKELPKIAKALKDIDPKIITAIAAIGGLATVLLPVIGIIGTLIPAFEAVGAAIGSVVAWIGGLGIISTLAGWFSALGAGIAGFFSTVIGLVKGFSLIGIIDSIVASIGGFAFAVTEFFASIGTFISGLSISGVLAGISSAFTSVMAAIGTALTTIILPILAVIAIIGGLIYAIIEFKDFIWDAIKPAIDILVKSFKNIDFTPIINAFNLLKQNIEPLLSILKFVGAVIAGVVVVAFGIVISVINAVINAIAPLVAVFINLVGIITSVLGIIVGIVTLDGDLILQSFKTLWENVKGVFVNAFDAIKGFVMGFVDSIVKFFTSLYDTLVGHSIIPDMVNAIFDWFRNLWNTGVSLVQGFISGVANVLYTIGSIAYNTFSNFVSTIRNFIGSAASAASSIANSIKDAILGLAGGLYNAGVTLIQNVIDGLWSMLGKLKKTAGNIAKAIADFFPHSPAKEGALKDFPEVGYTLMDQLMQGIDSQKNKINDIVSNVTQGITNNVAVNTAVGTQGNVTIPIYLDGRKITEVVAPYMTKMIKTQSGY